MRHPPSPPSRGRSMPRSIWKGSISFGMVAIPVNLFTAVQSKSVSFHLLHEKCKTRIHNKHWCAADDCEVDDDEIVRAYEYSRGHYVVMEDSDFQSLPVASKHVIELSAFVQSAQVDPVYYSKSYYLEPTEAGLKPYALLLRALEKKGLIGIAKITLREKEHLCALRPNAGTLFLETLYYPDEIKLSEPIVAAATKVAEKELDTAFTLIDILTEDFKPEQYQDDYRVALMERIEDKVAGKQIEVVPDEEPKSTKVVDLMSALRASVEAVRKRGADAGDHEERAGRSPSARKSDAKGDDQKKAGHALSSRTAHHSKAG